MQTTKILQQRLSYLRQHHPMMVEALQNIADIRSIISANTICRMKAAKMSGSSTHRRMLMTSTWWKLYRTCIRIF